MRRLGVIGFCLLLAGCAGLGIGPKQVGGALGAGVGGAAGGVLGSQIGSGLGRTAATIAGASVGALFGGAIGSRMADSDAKAIDRTTQETLENAPTGVARAWRNPDTGRAGTVVASAAEYREDRPCRPFEVAIEFEGETERASGTACRRPDGTWQVAASG